MVVEVRVSVPCVCTPRLEMALAYALMVWGAMAITVRSGSEQGKTGGSPLVSWKIGW